MEFGRHMISVVIPTYQEADSIQEVIRRTAVALAQSGEEYELIVVDDKSGDGTAELAENLSGEFRVRVLRRAGRLGLASAVVDGWRVARGDLLAVIDGDLQHPPEILAALAAALRRSDADLAVASRYVAGGATSGWKFSRRVISWGATHLAATILPLKIAAVSDPMSGMFVVRASAVARSELAPLGYKILLEVLAKGRIERVVEVPYQFEERTRGSSKLGLWQYGECLGHLARLSIATGQLRSWFAYSLVGLSGALIDIGLICWMAGIVSGGAVRAVPVAVEAALVWNFLWNENATFTGRHEHRDAKAACASRLWLYHKVCLPGAILNAALTLVLVLHGVRVPFAAAAGVALDGGVNLLFNVPAIWRIWIPRVPVACTRAAEQVQRA